jgi:regulator of RNase E activity RraA
MNDTLLTLLKKVDTPTVCNAIEVAQGKRGFNAFTRGTMLASDPDAAAMVGYARTARIAAVTPPTETSDVIKARRMAYYRHMDFPECIGAYWGEINTNIHKGFGLSGALTNGVMRDLGDLPDGFPVVAGSIGPSHGFVHVKEVGATVSVFGMQVADSDLIHADQHGALVIPPDVLPILEEAIHKLLDTEKLVLDPARQNGFDFHAFEVAWAAFESART